MPDINELAVLTKTDKSHMLTLWEAVERLICFWAVRYRPVDGGRSFDVDDLIQAGFLALVDAVQGYDPEQCDFVPYLRLHVRKHFREVSGHRGTKKRPKHYSVSLDEPIGEDGDTRRLDLLADRDAHLAYDDVIEREAMRQDCAKLLAVWEGHSLKESAGIIGISPERARQCRNKGLLKVRHNKAARMIKLDNYSTRHVGLDEFRRTFTSEVEDAVLWRERCGV